MSFFYKESVSDHFHFCTLVTTTSTGSPATTTMSPIIIDSDFPRSKIYNVFIVIIKMPENLKHYIPATLQFFQVDFSERSRFFSIIKNPFLMSRKV